MKKFTSILLAMVLVLSILVAMPIAVSAGTYSGKCGDEVYWHLNSDTGILIISGTGRMDELEDDCPWYDYSELITEVIVEHGVTRLSGYVFYAYDKYAYDNLIKATIAGSVDFIGMFAFYGCTNLNSVFISEGVEIIFDWAFRNCTSLESIIIPQSVYYIADNAFENCPNLTIYGETDSYAEEWADINNIPFASVPEHIHSYIQVTNTATCTTDGYTTYTCDCGDSYIADYVDATGHIPGAFVTVTEPKIGVEGLKEQRCTACNELLDSEIIPALTGPIVPPGGNIFVRFFQSIWNWIMRIFGL